MEGTMRAAVLHGARDIRIEERDIPETEPGTALVNVKAVGVCGSDVHYYRYGQISGKVVEEPLVPGHEFAGEVVEVGEGVQSLRVGDKVAVEPGIPCGKCEYCRIGKYNICKDVLFCGTPPVNGAYQEYYCSPEHLAHRVPDEMSHGEGAMIEPLAVAVHAVDLVTVRPADSVVVIGCGPIGLTIIAVARAAGAGRIIASDLLEPRLQMAGNLGADVLVNARTQSLVDVVNELTEERGVDIAIEAAGAASTPQQMLDVAKCGGTVAWGGIPHEDFVEISPHEARRKELSLKFIRRFRHTYPRAIQLVRQGLVDVKSLITHSFALDDIESAFELVDKYEDGVIKAMIEP